MSQTDRPPPPPAAPGRSSGVHLASAAVRRAGPADVEAVRMLVRAAYARWMPVIGREPKPMTADYAAAVRDHRIDLFEADGALVALIEMAPAADHLLIENVAVATAVQGRGLGRELLAHAETVARSLGLGELRLYTNALMAGNIRLYGRLGYRIDRVDERAPGWTVVHMGKTLAAPA